MKIRTLIVDDEAPARSRLRQLLKDEPDFELIGECANGRQALAAIEQHRPDLVFLDVQMPRLNGLEVCQTAAAAGPMPRIVFVTAYNQYALQAFEVHAIDYLLKPFDRERFQKTLEHARKQIQQGQTGPINDQVLSLLKASMEGAQKQDRLAFRIDGRVVFIRSEDFAWLEADGNYVQLHTAGATHHLRDTLSSLEAQLPASSFLRISRSHMVNLDRVREIQPLFYGDHVVILHDGTRLNLSRNFRDRLERILMRRT